MKFLILLFVSITAFAQTPVVYDQVTYNGTGCAGGTVATVLSPDGTTLSLLFDEFRAEVPNYEPSPAPRPGSGPNYRPPRQQTSVLESHKTCHIAFTTTLPAGMAATGIEITLSARGNTMLDLGIQAYFSTILVGHRGLANSVGPQVKVVEHKLWRTSRSEIAEDWNSNPKVVVPLRSNCANQTQRSIRFELKNHLEAKILTNDVTKSGIVTVDSQDTQGFMHFVLKTAPCGSRLAPNRGTSI